MSEGKFVPGSGIFQHSSQGNAGLEERRGTAGFHSELGKQWQPGASNHLQKIIKNLIFAVFMDLLKSLN